jgi:hypothetical protein
MHDVKHPAWELEKTVGFLSGVCGGGLRECNGGRVKFWWCFGIVLGRAVTTSPSTGLEVAVPGRPDVFLSPEPQGTLIRPCRGTNFAVAPLAVV